MIGPPDADDPELAACTVLHVDMDAFYASVLLRDRPELRPLPVVVAGGLERGVVLCATYPARRRGISSGMPTAQAARLARDLVVVRPDFGAFAAASDAVFAVFGTITPEVEPLSQEEAFLHVGGARRVATPLELARRVRRAIWAEQQITCSVGVAATRSVAKLASRRCKPDGLLVVPPRRVRELMDPMDVGELWGVGPATRERIARIGVTTVGEVRALPIEVLRTALGSAGAREVHALVRGEEAGRLHTAFRAHERARSIGSDRTQPRDLARRDEVLAEVLRLVVEVMAKVRRGDLRARVVSLRMRHTDFTTLTRSHTFTEPVTTTQEAYAALVALHDAERPGERGRPLRLVGVRVTTTAASGRPSEQLELGVERPRWREVDAALDRVRGRFGRGAVEPATLVGGRRDGGGDGKSDVRLPSSPPPA
ncbi:DNA polymerase IV [Nocardioides zeae]|uniref:DNA polymerase IV n=1 Tax=Nocardioides imazamoxiresistens TaxID=3231893 RepID=A0ABU3Q0F6_9ACTN|nr:DNA polymerase IV [Nocardioides zeae]MDT9594495.1 DNA polymerase IV [Nocardioides zeae]